VIYGSRGSFPSSLSSINGNNGFFINGPIGSFLGTVVNPAGDINHDGTSDFLFGGPGDNSIYIIFGIPSSPPSSSSPLPVSGSSLPVSSPSSLPGLSPSALPTPNYCLHSVNGLSLHRRFANICSSQLLGVTHKNGNLMCCVGVNGKRSFTWPNSEGECLYNRPPPKFLAICHGLGGSYSCSVSGWNCSF